MELKDRIDYAKFSVKYADEKATKLKDEADGADAMGSTERAEMCRKRALEYDKDEQIWKCTLFGLEAQIEPLKKKSRWWGRS